MLWLSFAYTIIKLYHNYSLNVKINLMNNNAKHRIILFLTVIFIVVTFVIAAILFRFYMSGLRGIDSANVYDKYFVMITDSPRSSFWQSVYQGALDTARENNDFVELLGENISGEYTREELMRIAIASKVDGIIVEADESDEMTELINEASRKGVPVITLYSDNTRSERLSFVGVGGYNIGREYGRQVFNIIKEKRREDFIEAESMPERSHTDIYVLVNTDAQDTGQNIIISGLQETISQENATDSEFEISIVPVDNTNDFAVEESIRDLFTSERIPDVLVCLNELNTICAYQAVVDFNKVGEVDILGYYDSDTIINAIDRNVVYATISIDTPQLGRYCVEALNECYDYGTANQYFTADVTLINKDNVSDFIAGEDGNDK